MGEIDCFYGVKNLAHRKACISQINSTYYVEFYDNEVMIAVWSDKDKSLDWAESLAENFCGGLIKVEPWEFKLAI